MPTWVGGGSYGRKQVGSFWVGDEAGVPRELEKLWAGDLSGTPRLVWEKITQNTLTATPNGYNRIDLSWTSAAPGATYVLKRGSTAIYEGTGLSKSDTGLSGSKTYNYTLTSSVAGNTVTATASATTPARPTEDRTWTGSAVVSASYQEDGDNRYTSRMYGGRYDSTHGRQKSLVMFGFPADVRSSGGCIAITKVEIQFFTRHHYYWTGGKVRFASHRQYYPTGFPAKFPGSQYPTFGEWSADRGKFVGGGSTEGTGWINITNLVPTGWAHNMATEIRTQGCWGIAIYAPNDTYNYYGYWDGAGQEYRPRIRLEYTVNL